MWFCLGFVIRWAWLWAVPWLAPPPPALKTVQLQGSILSQSYRAWCKRHTHIHTNKQREGVSPQYSIGLGLLNRLFEAMETCFLKERATILALWLMTLCKSKQMPENSTQPFISIFYITHLYKKFRRISINYFFLIAKV